ncbi:formyltetrahydrofolate deformylase [Pseudonocardia sulfidoxydans NBRC 16205]|uniref:Formyltetrahydrofolate deformylase n=1 Tax=Pseudonocardia sulfidoxydans NBRC 16205 TaxID=1223511 RepID=A0A511DH53_9PSEU|nr:formyltetrahydrofolate deformylase [Pseudonocardia sulfidoxydans]GEL23703.1 formyltetrahydrofolate deformylase [Pseudonocardia sulfidoxydans NBRC 16205]
MIDARRTTDSLVLLLSCPDGPGVVHAVSGVLLEHGHNIVESQQYRDPRSGSFFMRVEFTPTRSERSGGVREGLARLGERFGMTWRLAESSRPQRTLIMVSRYGHCLNDLLYRCSVGRLNIEPVAVVSNHPDLAFLADNFDVPFRHVPVTGATKQAAEARLLELVADLQVDLVVLARYMQILSDDLCKKLDGRAINIHHSILPSFKGARPYHQAYDRGVKLVGATAHYVTADLDEGPIIEQEVARVDHSMSPEEVTALGRDNECLALARAVQWHSDNRVVLDGPRAVVFR